MGGVIHFQINPCRGPRCNFTEIAPHAAAHAGLAVDDDDDDDDLDARDGDDDDDLYDEDCDSDDDYDDVCDDDDDDDDNADEDDDDDRDIDDGAGDDWRMVIVKMTMVNMRMNDGDHDLMAMVRCAGAAGLLSTSEGTQRHTYIHT